MGFDAKTIGILGAGQLGRMLALAGYPLGFKFRFLDPSSNAPCAALGEMIVADYADERALRQFVSNLDFATYEFENVPASTARFLEHHVKTCPPSFALDVAQDRLKEKELFSKLGIPCAPYAKVDSLQELAAAADKINFPSILKTRRFGYDGKGQVVLKAMSDLPAAWQKLGPAPLILEGLVPFARELSVIAVRAQNGEVRCYPPVHNIHLDGILRLSLPLAESECEVSIAIQARELAEKVTSHFNYVGVIAIETFEVAGTLLANEIAPRVHNSGHWTIEGAETSQFTNHLRAISGLPLGGTKLRGRAAMVNILGELPDIKTVLSLRGSNLHLYGKEPRPARKIGHITVCAQTSEELSQQLSALAKLIEFPMPFE